MTPHGRHRSGACGSPRPVQLRGQSRLGSRQPGLFLQVTFLHNLFKFVTLGLTPDRNILRNWNKRKKTFGSQNLGKGHIGTATVLLIHHPGSASRTGRTTVVWKVSASTTRGAGRHTVQPTARYLGSGRGSVDRREMHGRHVPLLGSADASRLRL